MDKHLQNNVELIFKAHYHEFCLLSYSYVESWAQSQDIVQDVFVKILTSPNLEKILNLKQYVKHSIKNTSLNYLERSKKHTSINEATISISESDFDKAFDYDLDWELNKAICKLPNQSRKVFELCAIEGYKYNTAAKSLGISENTVKTHMKKAYKILRSELRNARFFILVFIICLIFYI